MDNSDYINYVIENLKSIILETIGLNITDIITPIKNNIAFKISKQIKKKEMKSIQTEIDSKLNNWIIFELSGNINGDGSYFYRVVNFIFKKDVIMYNRKKYLKELI